MKRATEYTVTIALSRDGEINVKCFDYNVDDKRVLRIWNENRETGPFVSHMFNDYAWESITVTLVETDTLT